MENRIVESSSLSKLFVRSIIMGISLERRIPKLARGNEMTTIYEGALNF